VTTCLRLATLNHLHLLWCESSMVKTIASEIKLHPSTHITCKNLPAGAQSVNCGFIALSCKNYKRNKIPLAEVHKTAFALWLLSADVNLPTFRWNLQMIIWLFRVGTTQTAASCTLKMRWCWNLLRTKLLSQQNKEITDRNQKSLYIQWKQPAGLPWRHTPGETDITATQPSSSSSKHPNVPAHSQLSLNL
jgi:hypothetical protein